MECNCRDLVRHFRFQQARYSPGYYDQRAVAKPFINFGTQLHSICIVNYVLSLKDLGVSWIFTFCSVINRYHAGCLVT